MSEEEQKKEEPVVQEPNNKKNSNSTVIILLVIIAVLIGVIVFLLLGAIEKKNAENKERPNQENTEVQPTPTPEPIVEEVEIDSEIVTTAMESFNSLNISANLLYSDKYDINNISKVDLIDTMLNQVSFYGCGMKEENNTVDELNTNLQKVINGKTITFNDLKEMATRYDSYNNAYIYSSDKEQDYMFYGIRDDKIYLGSSMCEGPGKKDIVYKRITKAEKSEDMLYVYETKAFYEIDYDNDTVNYYSDPNKTLIVESFGAIIERGIVGGLPVEQTEEISWEKYNTYKISFKLINGTYYFQTLELVK